MTSVSKENLKLLDLNIVLDDEGDGALDCVSKVLSFLGLLAAYALLFISLCNPVSMKCHCSFVFSTFHHYASRGCITLYCFALLSFILYQGVSALT